MHERAAIRKAVVSALVGRAPAFATSARDRVTSSRQAPIREAELPTINVYVDGETVDDVTASDSPRELTRTVVLVVEGWAGATADLDDVLDDLALEIERAVDADPFLGDTAADSVLTNTEIGLKIDGSRPLGCVHLEFAITYRTPQRVAEATDDFLRADVQHGAADAAPEDRAHDLITLPL